MALLLDTHTFLWFINDDARLSPRAAEQIGDPAERVVLSVVSAWEVTIKTSIGKLALDRALDRLWPESIKANSFDELNVTAAHIFALNALPLHHRDPFEPPVDRPSSGRRSYDRQCRHCFRCLRREPHLGLAAAARPNVALQPTCGARLWRGGRVPSAPHAAELWR